MFNVINYTNTQHVFHLLLFALKLKSRMQAIQLELQKLSEMLSYNEDDVKRFSHFKSEFNHIFKELRRRKSVKIRRPSIFAQVGLPTSHSLLFRTETNLLGR